MPHFKRKDSTTAFIASTLLPSLAANWTTFLLLGLVLLTAPIDADMPTENSLQAESQPSTPPIHTSTPLAMQPEVPQNKPSNTPQGVWLQVESATQQLHVREHTTTIITYPISTSKYGLGEVANSYRTPRGWHYVRARIGDDAALGSIFVGRQHTGRTATIHTDKTDTEQDLILSRILWLSGLEAGRNKGVHNGANVDSFARYIYIHGTDEEGLIGTRASHGCVRMRNADVIALFDTIPLYTLVLIE